MKGNGRESKFVLDIGVYTITLGCFQYRNYIGIYALAGLLFSQVALLMC